MDKREKLYWSFNFSFIGLLLISLAFVSSLFLQMRLPVPSDLSTLIKHEAYQYYTRPTENGPYAEKVVELHVQGRWHPQLYGLGPHLQYDNLWCLQVEVTILKDNTPINETAEWIAVKPIHRPWQLFPLEFASAARAWKQRCGGQVGN